MTIKEAISQVDALLQNTYDYKDKVRWLSDLDWMVKRELVDTHEGAESVNFVGYDVDTDPDTVLLAPAPFDKMYLRYLEAQIHKHNEENTRWNNAIMLYNNEWQSFADHYNRTHLPRQNGTRFIF